MNKLPTNWKEVKLGDIIDIIMGQSPKSQFYNKDKEGMPFLQGSSTFGHLYPSFEVYSNDIKKIAVNGSVLMSVRAPVGDLNMANTDICIGRGLCSINGKNKSLNRYIFYLLNYYKAKIVNIQTGTVFGAISKDNILNFKVSIPQSEAEQKRIASILSSFDDKIELNNKTNKILEEMAQTIFEEWFINFNFPNANGKPYKKSGGEMIGSELGGIPKGWKVGVIGDLISNLFNGDWGKDKNKEKYTEEVICIRGADIGDISKGFDGKPVIRFILEKNLKSKKLLEGDIVIECSGGSPTQSTGRCIFVTENLLSTYDKPLICTNFCKVIKVKEKEYMGYTYNLLWYLYNTRLFFLFENGTTGIKNLDINNLFKRHPIFIPDKKVVSEFNKIFLNLIDLMHANKKENEKLSKIRDSLLPKLMAGEIRAKK